jgi:diguanylate cyclase (GGDEF)-like protein
MGLADHGAASASRWVPPAMNRIARFWPLVLLARVVAGFLVLGLPARLGQPVGIALGAVLAGTLFIDAAICLATRLPAFHRVAPHRRMWVMLLLATASATAFGLWPLVGAIEARPDIILAQFSVALIATAIFGAQRVLALGYAAGATATLLLAAPSLPVVGAAIVSLLGILLVGIGQARVDHATLVRRQTEALLGERAERLLTDYEEAGRGWFWETDRDGRISYISATLARAFGDEDLAGRPLTELVHSATATAAEPSDGQRTIGFHLSARTAFSDIAVRAAIEGEERWWSISGQPVLDAAGHFEGFRGHGTDLTEMRRSQAEATRLAKFDSLTGLANRVQMLRTLEQSIVDRLGRTSTCALMLLDLDRFKEVNDTLGHPAGDALLRRVAQRLLRVVGDRGQVGRLGGDEFKIILPGTVDRTELGRLAQAIIASLSQPYEIERSQVVIGASIGIAVAPDDGVTTEALIRNADLALYAAKADGRGLHRFYVPDMHADAEDRRQLEHDLRQALVSGGLHMQYQPVVCATTERIAGFEALLRWDHPERGAISPAQFVPIAEDAGLISAIGEWVLRTACNDAARWPGDTRIAVNVSPIQFANPALPSIVMSAISNAGIAPGRLELEITESVFLNDDNDTDAMFQRLKGIGVRLALDDFGTGYSSLGYLKTAPFDKIKIDQSFVRGAAIKGSRNAAIMKSIVSLAEALDMETTAEGAETCDELDLIRALGCSHIQGFIYGRPMSAEAVDARFVRDETHIAAVGPKVSREQRKTMLRTVELVNGGYRYTARIRNISGSGAMIEGLYDVPVGTRFEVRLARDYVVAAVSRWSSGERIGIEFTDPVDLRRLGAAVVEPPTFEAERRRAAAG